MSDSYQAQYPADSSVSPQMKEFIEDFYRISDIPGKHELYVDHFTPDARFVMASKMACGTKEIMSLRMGMWSAVLARKHTVSEVFPFSNESNRFMLHGVVALELQNGASVNVDWAALAQVTDCEDGHYRMKDYQVYMDTGIVSAATQL